MYKRYLQRFVMPPATLWAEKCDSSKFDHFLNRSLQSFLPLLNYKTHGSWLRPAKLERLIVLWNCFKVETDVVASRIWNRMIWLTTTKYDRTESTRSGMFLVAIILVPVNLKRSLNLTKVPEKSTCHTNYINFFYVYVSS